MIKLDVAISGLDFVIVVGLMIGIATVAIYNPMMYACTEPHWSKKFLLGAALVFVSVAGLLQ